MGKSNLFDDLVKAINGFVKDDISKDNFVFKLHRVFTVILCVIFTIVLSLSQVGGIYTHIYMNKNTIS